MDAPCARFVSAAGTCAAESVQTAETETGESQNEGPTTFSARATRQLAWISLAMFLYDSRDPRFKHFYSNFTLKSVHNN